LKRDYYRGMIAADTCAELQQLKQQYEFALRVWGENQFPIHNEPVGTKAWRSEQLQLKQKALDARNATNDRVLVHKLTCPLCAANTRFKGLWPVKRKLDSEAVKEKHSENCQQPAPPAGR
jgi:hypothetical protein